MPLPIRHFHVPDRAIAEHSRKIWPRRYDGTQISAMGRKYVPMKSNPTRRILLLAAGLSPQIVTETLYALAVERSANNQPIWLPDEVHLITTTAGAREALLNLLDATSGWFYRLCRDYRLPAIVFDTTTIHVLTDAIGKPLDDIRSPADNEAAADFITGIVRKLTADPAWSLHVSIAGGRKTMGFYLGYALSLYGRAQDRLSHVLVSEPYESNRDFYYPTPQQHPLRVLRRGREETFDARDARIELADIPFVRLRDGIPERLLAGATTFSETVSAAQASHTPTLIVDVAGQRLVASGERVVLGRKEFAIYLWLARRASRGAGAVALSKREDAAITREYLATYGTVVGVGDPLAAKLHKTSFDADYFRPARSHIHAALAAALGPVAARAYLIQNVGGRRTPAYALTLPPLAIEIKG
jgi:CRISPR-associated protein (TIGR02584 family)